MARALTAPINVQRIDTTNEFTIEADPFFAQDLRQMAKAVNYRQWQFKMISPYLGRKVLEVGGGIGNFTPDLARVADSVVSVEPNNYCYAQLAEKTRGMPNVKVYNITAESLDRFMGADYQADTVVCMNVLEHLEDDELAVNTFSKRLAPGGLLVLLIPAVPWLFGEIDRRLGHYRRYSKGSAAALMRKTGMTMVRMRYFNFIGVWGWLWNARVAKSLTQSDGQIHFFDNYIVPWESRLEKVIAPPVGQSLLVVARKG
ncbi:MAG TPA: class I SAM-dependent methyltransferase [Verrucomicrobiae bacterium]|jgi:2-polyprenyl-3-methyl-5-hydroxy-6-metoxy-1,4-benzoquinol methylase|nr:class I SAM-dependent methyltransferase [Verrucomicrobiae bacterium]